jgi:ArsR family metal-binding transcriptional regulator
VRVLTTFGRHEELSRACAVLDTHGLPYELLRPDPLFARVAVPCLVMDAETRMALAARAPAELACAGWVEYRPTRHAPPAAAPAPAEDVLGEVAIMVLAPCVADAYRIRLIAHIGGSLGPVLPYLNAEMPHAIFNARSQALTYMDEYRMMTLCDRRITIAKADEIVDAWRILESIRRRAADVWARRATIRPNYERREKPPAIEIFKRLPRTNCRACGEPTCLAFAARVHAGDLPVTACRRVFEGEYGHLRDALLVIAEVLGPPEV